MSQLVRLEGKHTTQTAPCAMVTFQPFIEWQRLDLIKTHCHSINHYGKLKKKTFTIPTSKSSPLPLPFSCLISRALPCLSIKMRMVRGLCHGRPVGGDWLGSEASPTTTLVKLAWDVENYYFYYHLATWLTTTLVKPAWAEVQNCAIEQKTLTLTDPVSVSLWQWVLIFI